MYPTLLRQMFGIEKFGYPTYLFLSFTWRTSHSKLKNNNVYPRGSPANVSQNKIKCNNVSTQQRPSHSSKRKLGESSSNRMEIKFNGRDSPEICVNLLNQFDKCFDVCFDRAQL